MFQIDMASGGGFHNLRSDETKERPKNLICSDLKLAIFFESSARFKYRSPGTKMH